MTGDPPPTWFGQEGIDLLLDGQLALLHELEAPGYQDLFLRLRADPRLRPSHGGRGASDDPPSGPISNDYFPSPDAELYAAMIVRERPSRIVEVGSGFSTLIARHAIEHASLACELCVLDPDPRIDVDGVADRVVRGRVEESGLSGAPGVQPSPAGSRGPHRAGGLPLVEPGTLLFIDSSHVVEAGGDGPFLYCELLPSLPPGVLVHAHDIYIPYDYPPVYVRWGYTEQYVLHALLAHNPLMEVVCAPYLLSRRHPDAMRRAFGDGVARERSFEGASFWMRTV